MACLPYMSASQRIHAADISKESIKVTCEKAGNHPAFAGGTTISHYPTSFQANCYDLIVTTEVVEHLKDDELEAMLSEVRRVLKPDGYIFLTTPFKEDLEVEKTMCPECGCTFHRWQHMRSWDLESLTYALEKNGFTTIECQNIQWGPRLLKWYFRAIGRPGNGIYYIGRKS
jgi:cyclopropane fatty-acyl-phospholipid synthase-like methyltransferase